MRDLCSSGLNGATADQWEERLSVGASVAGITEGANAGRPLGWSRDGRQVVDVLWKKPWTPLRQGVAPIPTPTWHRGSKAMHSVDLRWVLLDHPSGWTLLRASAHLPAHLYRRRQRDAHAAAVDGLVPALLLLQRDTGADEVTCSLDANMDLRLKRNTRRLERHGFHVVAPTRPTHGLRVIDGFVTTMHGTATTLRADKGFDHHAVVAELHRTKEKA